jgi:diadenosine tetraphosphate (Ap4A) HIT family hydrolase
MNTPLLPISARVARIREGDDPTLLLSLPSGHAVLNPAQPPAIRGCCILLPDPVVSSLNELESTARAQFLDDLARLGDAVLAATGAERVNYLILCNQVPELHAHCIPRFASEDPALRRQGPFEAYDFGAAPALEPGGADRELLAGIAGALRRLVDRG